MVEAGIALSRKGMGEPTYTAFQLGAIASTISLQYA
jgi:hypothetical protein